MPATLNWPPQSIGGGCQCSEIAALLNSLSFTFANLFPPKYRVKYYGSFQTEQFSCFLRRIFHLHPVLSSATSSVTSATAMSSLTASINLLLTILTKYLVTLSYTYIVDIVRPWAVTLSHVYIELLRRY